MNSRFRRRIPIAVAVYGSYDNGVICPIKNREDLTGDFTVPDSLCTFLRLWLRRLLRRHSQVPRGQYRNRQVPSLTKVGTWPRPRSFRSSTRQLAQKVVPRQVPRKSRGRALRPIPKAARAVPTASAPVIARVAAALCNAAIWAI